jgi:protein involved in polysaccharide export with SLBB domain
MSSRAFFPFCWERTQCRPISRRSRQTIFAFCLALFLSVGTSAFSQAPSSNQSSQDISSQQRSNPSSGNNSNSSASASGSIPTLSAPTGYILSANDQVAVEVFGEDDLRTNGRLNGEGNLSVPLLGSIHLAGLTLGQAASRLTDLYGRDYLVNPKVNVMLIGYAKRRFTMLGQINRPGSYEMPDGSPEGIELLEAIAMAGGYTRIAAPEKVSVKRGNQVMRVDAKRQARGGHDAFTVLPGDTVTVGESIF